MKDQSIRNRHRVRRKVGRKLVEELNNIFSTQFDMDHSNIDSATVDDLEMYIINNEIFAVIFDGEPFLSIRGL